MCDRLSHTYGYICDECFEELVSLGVEADIEEFINSPKSYTSLNDETIARVRFEDEFTNSF